MGHIYFGKSTKHTAYKEYIVNWLGNIHNVKGDVRMKIGEIIKRKNPNINIPLDKNKYPLIKEEHLSILSQMELDEVFKIAIFDKFSSNKFDSYIVPSIITQDKFLNRNPYEIEHEIYDLDKSKKEMMDILEKGFPVLINRGLYVFYVPNLYLQQGDINIYDLFDNLYPSDTIKKLSTLKFFKNRDYWNTLIFLINIFIVLYDLKYKIKRTSEVIVWKKQKMEGSLFVIPEAGFLKIYELLGEGKINPKNTNLYYILELLIRLHNILKKYNQQKAVEKIADIFSYYLLAKQVLDSNFINNLVKILVEISSQQIGKTIKFLNKYFIIKFMKEMTNYQLDEYFNLGQLLGSKIYELFQDPSDAEKLVDRFAKDLRNEDLPEYFAETFEKDIVWLKSRGLDISEDLSEKFGKLIYDLRTSDLSKFYLIKASIILGLLSHVPKAKKKVQENQNDESRI